MLDCSILVEEFDRDLTTDLQEMFEVFHQNVEALAIDLEENPDQCSLINALYDEFDGLAQKANQIGLDTLAECLSEASNALQNVFRLGCYPTRMSELLLLVNDRILHLVKGIVFDHTLDFSQIQPLLVALQYITLAQEAAHLEATVASGIAVMVEGVAPQVRDSDNDSVVLFDVDEASLPEPTGRQPEIFERRPSSAPIITLHQNPVYQARDFIAAYTPSPTVGLVIQISDSACEHKRSHTGFLLEMALSCNFFARSPIDPADLYVAIACHDVALAKYPKLLGKPGCLNSEERQLIMSHPLEGADMASVMRKGEDVRLTVLHHHERVNGSGYPLGLKGDAISGGGKLLAIVDSFHAMVEDRPYRRFKKDWQRALVDIKAGSNQLYDPEWVRLFSVCLQRFWLDATQQNEYH